MLSADMKEINIILQSTASACCLLRRNQHFINFKFTTQAMYYKTLGNLSAEVVFIYFIVVHNSSSDFIVWYILL